MRLSKYELTGEDYGRVLDQLCDEAKENGYSGGAIDYCIHIGVGFGSDEKSAEHRATAAVNAVIDRSRKAPPKGFAAVYEEVRALASTAEMIKGTNIFKTNVKSLGCRPFVLWSVKREHLLSLISGDLCVVVAFDVVSFIMLAREIGLEIRLSTRKEAHSILQKIGGKSELRWGGRILKMNIPQGPQFLLSGFYFRFITDLVRPLSFLSQAYTNGAF